MKAISIAIIKGVYLLLAGNIKRSHPFTLLVDGGRGEGKGTPLPPISLYSKHTIKGVKYSGIHTLPPYPQYTPTQMEKEAHTKLTSPWRQVKLCKFRYDRYRGVWGDQ